MFYGRIEQKLKIFLKNFLANMEKLKCEGGGVAKLTENAPYIFFF